MSGPVATTDELPAAAEQQQLGLELSRVAIEHHSKSFSLAARLLGTQAREDAQVVYAYCRRVDDAVDDATAETRPLALEQLRQELDAVFDRNARLDPTLHAFREVVFRRALPRPYLEELLAGMAMDVGSQRYDSLEQLLLYCHRVAGVVGLLMCHVFEVGEPRALVHAAHLGLAMQLTNISRDVREDWERGRLYLPVELLGPDGAAWANAAAEGRPLPPSAEREIARATERLLTLADRYYESGNAGVRYLPWQAAIAVTAAHLIYRDIGRVVRARGSSPFGARAIVSSARKRWLAIWSVCSVLAALPLRWLFPVKRRLPPAVLDWCDVPRL